MGVTGTVLSLHRWPVKSMAGERVDALRVDRRGAGGDRTHALFDTFKDAPRRLTARQAPRLLAWSAAYDVLGGELDVVHPPEPRLRAPDGRSFAWGDDELPAALAADLGHPVALVRDVAGQPDLTDSLLVTVEATRQDVERDLGRLVDLRRFRTNLHLALDAEPHAEQGWEGRCLRVGEAELELLHPCVRCVIPTRDPDTQDRWPELLRWLAREHATRFGINARALAPARVRVGERVALV